MYVNDDYTACVAIEVRQCILISNVTDACTLHSYFNNACIIILLYGFFNHIPATVLKRMIRDSPQEKSSRHVHKSLGTLTPPHCKSIHEVLYTLVKHCIGIHICMSSSL